MSKFSASRVSTIFILLIVIAGTLFGFSIKSTEGHYTYASFMDFQIPVPYGYKKIIEGNSLILRKDGIHRQNNDIYIYVSDHSVLTEDVVITKLGSGSGGTEYKYEAQKQIKNGFIIIEAYHQTEASSPHFKDAEKIYNSLH